MAKLRILFFALLGSPTLLIAQQFSALPTLSAPASTDYVMSLDVSDTTAGAGGSSKKFRLDALTTYLQSNLTLSISTGVTGLGTGVGTFLQTPSGANLASALTTALPTSKGGTGATALTDLITLGTHTTGNYVATITGTANEITVTGSGSETAGVTLALPSSLTFTGKAVAGGTYTAPVLSGTVTGTYTLGGTPTITSPILTTSATTSSTTFALFNGTATTINAFGAATSLNVGASAATVLSFGGASSAAEFRFLEPSGSGTNYIGFKAAAMSASTSYIWPTVAATAGQILSADSTPTNLKWIDAASASVDQTTDYTWTGTHDFTGATVSFDAFSATSITSTNFSINGGATPTVSAFGDLSSDNNQWATGHGAPVFYDGTAAVALIGVTKSDTPTNGQVPKWNTGGTITWEDDATAAGGTGDASTNTSSSVDSEVAVFSGTAGKTLKRATGSGLAKLTSGVLSTATAGTDYYNPSGTDVAVADGGTGRSTGTTAYALVATGTTATGAQQTLASGATTEILVGGGAAALPAWTTATGSGSPVRGTSPTIGTPIINDGKRVLNSPPGSDDTYAGQTIIGYNGTATQWDAVYFTSGGAWAAADANGSGTYPARGIAVSTASGAALTVLTDGIFRDDGGTSWTVGATVYLSTTAGGLTQTPPATTGDKVQVIGYALAAHVIMVKIGTDYGTAP